MRNLCLFITFLLLCGFTYSEEVEQVVKYVTPVPSGDVHFAEPFDAEDAIDSWTLSKADKEGVESEISKYNGRWEVQETEKDPLSGDTGLNLMDKARHHAISTSLDKTFVFEDSPAFVMQYEVNFQDGIECGGAYVKLLRQSDSLKLSEFDDKTPYSIMFGPDKCGEDYKLHFIFQHKNPLTGEFEEKHAPKPTGLQGYYTDKKSHLYTLVVKADNTFQIYVDQKEISSGSLLEDMSPPVNPPKEIEDVTDKKPTDWDDRETIPDETATKPDDWDEDAPAEIPDPSAEMPEGWLESEPLHIDDPEAAQPEDWDNEIDGEWEAPQIDNPECAKAPGCGVWEPANIPNPAFKGKWRAPHISNPAYKGVWKPRMIANPGYFHDSNPFNMASIGALGFELWSMSNNIMFDNILVTTDKSVADEYAAKTWALKREILAANEPGMVSNLISATDERPWLWIIYVLVVALPLVLLIGFCCRKSKADEVGEAKKTDAVSPDDPHDSEEEAEQEDEAAPSGGENSQAEEEGGDGDGADDDVVVTKNDLEADDDEAAAAPEEVPAAEEEVTAEVGDQVKKSPRARKPRIQD